MSEKLENSVPIISMIVAIAQDNGFGLNGCLPWSIPEETALFKKITTKVDNNAVIMGYNTYMSIPSKNRPLKNRLNIILSKNEEHIKELITYDVKVASSIEEAINIASRCNEVFIIGGLSVYKECLLKNLCYKIYFSRISKIYKCDVYFPDIPPEFVEIERTLIETSDENVSIYLSEYISRNTEEMQYLDLIKSVLKDGFLGPNRTDINTISKFGHMTRYSLRDNKIPLLTTKKMFFKGIVEELLWFISGSTDALELERRGSKIWKANSSREFLDKRGFKEREVGDLGPMYGFQWLHSGAKYIDCKTDYTGQGINQIQELINGLINDPYSRRHIISAWNPSQINEMAIAPCHCLFQFNVHQDSNGIKYLSCQMYQRSADIGLGVPFNIASYSLLTCMIAHCCNFEPYEFIHTIGSAHIYVNHIEQLKLQLTREPYQEPKLFINTENKDIFNFKYSDFVIKGYKCHDVIKMDMAV